MKAIEIIDAGPEDAPMIAEAILEAVGEEIVAGIGGGRDRQEVKEMFTALARRTDSQYSYLNSRIALVDGKHKAGVCVSYPGACLRELRRSFFEEANNRFGWGMTPEEVEAVPEETTGEEFYLDSLAVVPEYRGRGVAKVLITDACRKADEAGLPLGLLVADHNPGARRLYDSLGFRPVARRTFAGEEMTNMRL
ncbi:MAG: GNAT family N-acetyltransferase [Muribaculaceae bacterium]|nr:GNAT family N-acetyltransferase [Muribaculaceae bacterium]